MFKKDTTQSYLGAINWHKFASSKHVLWDILEKDFWMMHLELRIKHILKNNLDWSKMIALIRKKINNCLRKKVYENKNIFNFHIFIKMFLCIRINS